MHTRSAVLTKHQLQNIGPVWLQSGVRTFVLIPGYGGSAWVWSRVTALLVEAGHEVIAVDLPGDDETAGLPRYTELVVDAIGSRSDVVLAAGSLGGFTPRRSSARGCPFGSWCWSAR
jgi:pimeloyl-ACP methyl ester carboxylesterase